MYKNRQALTIQEVKRIYSQLLDSIESIEQQATTAISQQLETALGFSDNVNFKVLHPVFIRNYKMPNFRFKDEPLDLIGLDIETNHKTGEPKLLGFYYPETDVFSELFNPTLETFFNIIKDITDNSTMHLITWGKLDIQAILRLFNPTESERHEISRGISANIKHGEIIGTPPVIREIGNYQFYVAHYIPGRSLKLGYLKDGRESVCWIFNVSQFFPGTIANTAKGVGLNWIDFPKDTHLINWNKYQYDLYYKLQVRNSNRQDAKIVTQLASRLQQVFYSTFSCYPSLLVSTGSLCDAAVAKMLSDVDGDYESNSWRWLVSNAWKDVDPITIANAEALLSEAYSAGYVDQFALGYFPKTSTADIAAAYPHKIRNLPDLRNSTIFQGENALEEDLQKIRSQGLEIETAIIRGQVCIPQTLKFHPITLRTYNRENYRPTGSYAAAYTLEERAFCIANGATFEEEEYVIIALKSRQLAPIALVSEKLGALRDQLLLQMKSANTSEEKTFLDGQQYIVKVIDNSIYGKTVMTTEIVENVEGKPQITGYTAGDRFNLLYGTVITARTRIQIAETCLAIEAAGGKPVMTMTDAVYWEGSPTLLPAPLIREKKTPGFFEPPHEVEEFYLIKTGQYEYRSSPKTFEYRMRGLNVDREYLTGNSSFFRKLVIDTCSKVMKFTHPKDIICPVNTRSLVTIGSKNLAQLAMVLEGTTDLVPFVMSSKQTERFITNWRDCLNGHIYLATPHIFPTKEETEKAHPLSFLTDLYLDRKEEYMSTKDLNRKQAVRRSVAKQDLLKKRFILDAMYRTKKPLDERPRFHRLTWAELEDYFNITREELYSNASEAPTTEQASAPRSP